MGNMFDYADSDYYSFLAPTAKIRLLCFYTAFVVAGQVFRWFVWKNVPRKYQSTAHDCITTFSVYGCTMANNYVYRVYGQSMHLLAMAVVGIGHALVFSRDGTTGNPVTHVMSIAFCRKNVLERMVTRFGGHVLGGLLCHPVATTFWQLLIGDYCSRRTELVMHCVADNTSSGEPIDMTISLILEFIGTLIVCWAATIWKQPVDICEVIVKVMFGSVLVCSDMKSAGVFLNPVMSNSLQFGCNGDFGQHLVIYWLAPIAAAMFFSFMFCVSPRRKAKATRSPCSDQVQSCSPRDDPTRRTVFVADCPCAVTHHDCAAAGEDAAVAACPPPVGREITARVQQVEAKGGEKQLAYVFDIPPTVCKKGLRLKHNIVLSKKSQPHKKKERDADDCPCTELSLRRRRLKHDRLYRGGYPDDGRHADPLAGCCPSMTLGDHKSSSLSKSLSCRCPREISEAEMTDEFDDILLNQGRQPPDYMKCDQHLVQADHRYHRASPCKRNGHKQAIQPMTEMPYSQQRASYLKFCPRPTRETRQNYRQPEGVKHTDGSTHDVKQIPRLSEFVSKNYRPSDCARQSDDQLDYARQSSRPSGARKSSYASGARESYRPSVGLRQSDGQEDDARKSSRPSAVSDGPSEDAPRLSAARESYRPSDGLRQSDVLSDGARQSTRLSAARESYRPSEGVRQSDGPSDDSKRISRQSGVRESYRPSGELRRSSDQSQNARPSAGLRQSRLSSSPAAKPTQRRSTDGYLLPPHDRGGSIPSASIPYPEHRGSLNQSSNSLIRQDRLSSLRSSVAPALQSIVSSGADISKPSTADLAVEDKVERPTRTEPELEQSIQNNNSQIGRRSTDQKSQPPLPSITDVVSYYASADMPNPRTRQSSADMPSSRARKSSADMPSSRARKSSADMPDIRSRNSSVHKSDIN